MTDGELRGIILEKFYELRHQKNSLGLSDIVSIDCGEQTRIGNICDQLGQHGLIEWRTLSSGHDLIDGRGKITANGVDVVEGTASAPITVTLHDQRISVSSSTNVQIGNSNTQSVTLNVGKLIAAVDHSNASEAEKKEAKSLLERIAGNQLVQKIL
ncbi:MAG: hypothetical protein WBG11_01200, partial [Methylocella sp.]